MLDVLGDGGILKEVVQPGEGPPIPQNASVLSTAVFFLKMLNNSLIDCSGVISPYSFSYTVHYSGFLEYSDQPFQTTTNFKHPRMMKLGRGQKFLVQVLRSLDFWSNKAFEYVTLSSADFFNILYVQ